MFLAHDVRCTSHRQVCLGVHKEVKKVLFFLSDYDKMEMCGYISTQLSLLTIYRRAFEFRCEGAVFCTIRELL